MDVAHYSVKERLRDGRPVEIRACTPGDRTGLEAAVARTSDESLYRRFFSVKRRFSDKERDYFLHVDFEHHVALVASTDEGGEPTIVAGARYVVTEPGSAEVAFVVIDDYQGHGLGSSLMRHLTAIAREAGLRELTAEVLAQNGPMLKVFDTCGLRRRTKIDQGVIHVAMQL